MLTWSTRRSSRPAAWLCTDDRQAFAVINIFTTDMDLFFEHADELERLREAGAQYASTLVGVTRLAFPEFLVEIEATATR